MQRFISPLLCDILFVHKESTYSNKSNKSRITIYLVIQNLRKSP